MLFAYPVFTFSKQLIAVPPPIQFKEDVNKMVKVDTTTTIHQLNQRAVTKKVGQKLKLKEKIALAILKKKLRKKQKQKKQKTDEFAITGFILGILSIVLPGLGILAIVFSNIGLKRIEREPEKRKGKEMAKAGKALGIIFTIISFLAALVIAVIFL